MSRYRVYVHRRRDVPPNDWHEVIAEYASPCAASAAADRQPIHAQAWDTSGEPRLVHDNGKWPGEAT